MPTLLATTVVSVLLRKQREPAVLAWPIAPFDAQVVVMAVAHGLDVATRAAAGFAGCSVAVVNLSTD